jgi:hypothetical protein
MDELVHGTHVVSCCEEFMSCVDGFLLGSAEEEGASSLTSIHDVPRPAGELT